MGACIFPVCLHGNTMIARPELPGELSIVGGSQLNIHKNDNHP
jgi:hypothetical protein